MTMQRERPPKVLINSFLIPEDQLSLQRRRQLRQSAIDAALREARDAQGDQDWVVRDLVPSDMPNLANNNWAEATGGTNTWNNSAFASGGTTAANTFMAVFGAQFIFSDALAASAAIGAANPAVTGLRITVGGKRVRQWNLYNIWRPTMLAGTPTNAYGPAPLFPVGYAGSPVVITEQISVTVAFYELTTTVDFAVALLGYVVEKAGAGAELSS